MSTGSTAAGGGDEDDGGGGGRGDSITPPAQHFRRPAPVQPAALSSNWTMISNSSLRDVDGEDLRDELVGYADAADCCGRSASAVGAERVAEEYY